MFKKKSVVDVHLAKKAPVIIHVRDEGVVWPEKGSNAQRTFGSFVAKVESTIAEDPTEAQAFSNETPSTGSIRKKSVYLRTSADLQCPSFCITIVRDDESEVHFTIFAKDIGKDNVGQYGLRFLSGTDEEMGNCMPIDAEIQGVWNNQSLWETRIILNNQDVSNRVTWTNLPSETLAAIQKAARKGRKLSEADSLIAHLSRSPELSIYRRFGSTGKNDADREAVRKQYEQFMLSSMYVTFKNGTWWWWQDQTDGEVGLFDPAFPFDHIPPPRWTVLSWSVPSERNDHCYTPSSWSSLEYPPIMPDSDTMAFGLLLGINRERQSFERLIVGLVENNGNRRLQASMLPHDKDREIFMISLWTSRKDCSGDWQTITPELETRVKVIVFSGQREYTFHGEVMEDIFGIGGHITCGVRAKDSNMHELHFWQDRTVEAELVFVSDATTFNRLENTVRKIRAGQQRKSGVDIPALILNKPVIVEGPTWLSQNASQAFFHNARKLCAGRKLDATQTNVVMDSIKSVVGGTYVWGAGGTGKTAVAMTTAAAHMFWNNQENTRHPKRRVAVTGPSNKSVDEALRQFMKIAESEQELRELVVVRFTGANYGRRAQRAWPVRNATTEDDNEAEEGGEHANFALYDMLKRVVEHSRVPDAKYDFEVQKEAWMDRVRGTEGPWKEHIDGLGNIKEDFQANQKKATREIQRDHHQALSKIFLSDVVDAVFVTCSSSAHEALKDFPAKVVFVEDAAHGTIPDVATGLATWMETLEHVFLSGDHLQLRPRLYTEGGNECFKMLEVSLLQRIVEDPLRRYEFTFLEHCYRSAPHLTEFPRWFYQNYNPKGEDLKLQLIDAESVKAEDSLQLAFKAFMRQSFGDAWNGRYRVGIDISGEDTWSEVAEGSTSSFNDVEAESLLHFIVAMLNFRMPDGSQPFTAANIGAEGLLQEGAIGATTETSLEESDIGTPFKSTDFGITTLYTAQERLIKLKLAQTGGALKDMKVYTVNKIQGGQLSIQMISMVMNVGSTLGWITDRNQLNVQFGRGRRIQIVFGNWLLWSCMRIAPRLNGVKNNPAFCELVRQFVEKDDIIGFEEFQMFRNGVKPAKNGFKSRVRPLLPRVDS